MKWEPAIYEHKAALIGKSPMELAHSADLLAEAVLKEYKIYQADYITVGLDVYNIEAEALGAELTVPGENECPDLAGLLYDLNDLPELALPDIPHSGRFNMLLEAGKKVQDALGDKTWVRVAASGPVTLAAKLVGLENLVMSLCMEDGNAVKLLEFSAKIAELWCEYLRENDLEVIIFDSMLAPPMFSPDMYEQYFLPLHQQILYVLSDTGQSERELVIGGDTAPIANFLPQTGGNIVLCDFACDAEAFKQALGDDTEIHVRRNINPTLLGKGNDAELMAQFKSDLANFANPIAGTGILPYNFDPGNLLAFKNSL